MAVARHAPWTEWKCHPVPSALRPRQKGRHFPDDIVKCIFLNDNVWISIKVSLTLVPGSPINNIPALIQIMALRRSGDKPLSEPMMVSLLTYICVTRGNYKSLVTSSYETCTLWTAGCVLLFVHYTMSLSPLCRFTWRHWSSKKTLEVFMKVFFDSGSIGLTNIA